MNSGETDLTVLLKNMSPSLDPKGYVFCSFPNLEWKTISSLTPKAFYQEEEGTTLVVEETIAKAEGMETQQVYNCITLNVHSSLDAVGLTAAVSAALTRADISANVMAAYYHDHIFVNVNDAEKAMEALNALTQ